MTPPVQGLQECLYDVLAVERTATPDALKIAYRKQAMKWHPDKIQQSGANPEAYQEATVRFQLISRAYEVLSDPVERAWYDSHRSAILSSASSSSNAAPGEFEFNVWPYFSPTAFSGFGETGKGFYAVYGEVFKKVHLQEQMFARVYGTGSVREAPDLGGPGTPYANVTVFYNYWQGFTTEKDFGWCDEYDVMQAPNRKVRRLMEEENKKIRKRERREYSDSVRQLAAFVKKRDKRVREKQLELQRIQKEKAEMRKQRQLQLEKEKQEQVRRYKEQDWTKPSEDDYSDESEDDGFLEDDWDRAGKNKEIPKEDDSEEFHCIICGKHFRSAKQWKNHEQSKKHIGRVSALKDAFLEDDEQSDSVDEENDSNEDDEDSMLAAMLKSHLRQNTATSVSTERSESGTANGSIEIEEFTEHFSPPPSHNDTGHCPNEDGEKDENDDEHEDSILAAMLSSQKNKQKAVAADRVEIVSSVEDGDTHKDNETKNFEEAGVSVSQDEFTVKDSYPNKEVGESVGKGKARRRAKQEKKQAAVFDRHAATAAELASKERMQGEVLDNDSKVDRTDDLPPTEVSNAEQGWEESVRLKEIAQQNRSKLSQRGKKMKKGKGEAKQYTHTCQTCGQDFESRSQLFKHITATNHAVLKSK
ncbi:unnamed protein product [Sphagnum jensenii]|uniref:Uncharacterized protein n=1 Tax=Sphagnum jensenii TaxID=128206 RepID=A0ABP0WLA4_9BRYO